MAELVINTRNIQHNINYLSKYFEQHQIHWSLITKVFSGDREFLKHVLTDEVIANIGSVGDSRLTSLRNLKEFNPNIRTIYIKPPARIYADEVVKYADISLNTSFSTICTLNEAAQKINKVHQVMIMIELGELREGIRSDDIMDFYEKVFELSHIEVVGVGSNLGCMYGVEPTHDKLLLLSRCRQVISDKFNKDLKYLSGGTSITLPLIEKGQMPAEINHFRIGEAAFFGITPLDNSQFKELSTETFAFNANIIELEEKELVPDGIVGSGNIGHTADYDQNGVGESSYKAILDFGLLDVNKEDIESEDEDLKFVGMTSDMLVVDIGKNLKPDGQKKYKVGDKLYFKVNYMSVARLLNSKFIDKRFVD